MKWLDVPISPIYSSNQGTSVAERLQGKLTAIGTALAEITSVDYLLDLTDEERPYPRKK